METNRIINPRLPHRFGVRRLVPIPVPAQPSNTPGVAAPTPIPAAKLTPSLIPAKEMEAKRIIHPCRLRAHRVSPTTQPSVAAPTPIPAAKLTPSLIPAKKEKKKSVKFTKFVRLQWKKPEIDAQGKPNPKGTFVGCGNKGKVSTKAGRGLKGVWIMHELDTKEIILEPLNNTGRFLRMFPGGRVNLTKKGAGVRAKWRLIKGGNAVGLADVHKRDAILLESLFVKDTVLGVAPKMTKRNTLKLNICGVSKTPTNTANTFTSFTVEEVNTTRMLTFAVSCQKNHVKRNKLNKNKSAGPNKKCYKQLSKLKL